MNQDYLPAILHAPPNSISMERALRQIKEIVENYQTAVAIFGTPEYDRCEASLQDIELMISKIKR